MMELLRYIFYLFLVTLPITYYPISSYIEKKREKYKKKKARQRMFDFFHKEDKDKDYYVISEYDLMVGYLKNKPVKKRKLRKFEYRGDCVDRYILTFKHPRYFDNTYFARKDPVLTCGGKVFKYIQTNAFQVYVTKDETYVKKIIDAIYHKKMALATNRELRGYTKGDIRTLYKRAIQTAVINKSYE